MIFVGCLTAGCGFHWNYKSSQAVIGDSKQHPHDHKFDIPGLTVQVRPLNDIRTFYMAYFIILPLNIKTEDTSKYGLSPFRVLVAFLPHMEGFGFRPGEINLQLGGKEIGPIGISTRKPPVSDLDSDFYKKEVTRGRVFCEDGIPDEYTPVSNNDLIKFEGIEEWHCFEVIFDIPTPSPDVEFSVHINGILHDTEQQEVLSIPFNERYWSRDDSFP